MTTEPSETHTCPRRAENGMHRADSPFRGAGENLDGWGEAHGLIGQPRGCTYCGSMHPGDFMDAVRSKLKIEPTDKGYKLYVEGIPAPEPDRLWCASSAGHAAEGMRPYAELTKAEKQAVKRDYSKADRKGKWFGTFITRPTVSGKFYTVHLSEEQGWEFDRLWKAHEINWGYPGAPYTPLYIPGPSTAERTSGS